MEQMASQPGPAIGLREVSKSFAATKAVDKVSFDVAQGSVVKKATSAASPARRSSGPRPPGTRSTAHRMTCGLIE